VLSAGLPVWPNGESKLVGLCVLEPVVANLLCDSGWEAVKEVAATEEGLGRACRVHCLAADVAACATGRILISERRGKGRRWPWELERSYGVMV